MYLVIIDIQLNVKWMHQITAEKITQELRSVISSHGALLKNVDNEPTFRTEQFQAFTRESNIRTFYQCLPTILKWSS